MCGALPGRISGSPAALGHLTHEQGERRARHEQVEALKRNQEPEIHPQRPRS
jgi:hypothetical protein